MGCWSEVEHVLKMHKTLSPILSTKYDNNNNKQLYGYIMCSLQKEKELGGQWTHLTV